jgi:aromatic ring-cleaving dioxygenase
MARRSPRATSHTHWRAAIRAGLVAGVIFIVLEVILWPLAGLGSPWEAVRMIAAILLGPGVLPPPASFDARIFMAAMVVHFCLSIIYAVAYATFRQLLLRGRLRRLSPFVHGLYGLFIYLINFYGFVALFPWFIEARHGISILVHVAWGMAIPWAYDARAERLVKGDSIAPDSSGGLTPER